MNNKQTFYTSTELALATKGTWKNLPPTPLQIKTISTDSRNECNSSMFLALEGEIFDGHNFIQQALNNNAAAVCVKKIKLEKLAIPPSIPVLLVHDTLEAYQNIATFNRLRLNTIKIIALTGSNGKTSVKDILYNIFSSEFGKEKVYATKSNTNNHIGVPLNLLNLTTAHKFAIIEMGSNHPGEIAKLASIAKPDIALITSIGPSHLEFFKTLRGVAKEKSSIFSAFNLTSNNIAIIPHNCPGIDIIKSSIPDNVEIITFGTSDNSTVKLDYKSSSLFSSNFSLKWQNESKIYDITSSLTGKHQASNAAATAAVSSAINIPHKNIAKHISAATVSGMRMKIINRNNITWINDAYNANPLSVKAGIDFLSELEASNDLKGKLYVVLGNMFELGKDSLKEHLETLEYTKKLSKHAQVICVGNFITKAAEKLSNSKIITFNSNKEVTAYLEKSLKPDDTVYLKGSRGAKLEEIENAFVK